MLLKANGKELKLFDFDTKDHHNWLVALSGGTDSALMLWFVCKLFPNKKIVCHTGTDISKDPFVGDYATEIFEWMQKEYPHVSLIHEKYKFDSSELKHIQQARKEIEESDTPEIFPTVFGHAKGVATREPKRAIRKKYDITLSMHGISKNPPIEVQEKYGFTHVAEGRRNYEYDEIDYKKSGNIHYTPWRNVDKSFIAEIYKQYNLLETLFPMTASCIGDGESSKWYTEPCKECFWCYEKKWAFGCYDRATPTI